MDRTTSTTIVIIVILLALLGMFLGWRGRQRRQAGLPTPDAVPAELGTGLLALEAFYVATTVADRELDRIAVAGLGYRSRARVTVAERGVVLSLSAVPEIFIPAEAILGADRATFTIDRVVETGGLVRITWLLGDTGVDSYLRTGDSSESAALIAAVTSIAAVESDAANSDSTNSHPATPARPETPQQNTTTEGNTK
ncbi:MAG: hypothetical protein JWM49_162 [Microbacteriaceae bacterium]|nr:hypothetical protein [Microbacteriaceae bacterium]